MADNNSYLLYFQLVRYFSWRAAAVSGPCAVLKKGSGVSLNLSARSDCSVTEESLWAVCSTRCRHRSPHQRWVICCCTVSRHCLCSFSANEQSNKYFRNTQTLICITNHEQINFSVSGKLQLHYIFQKKEAAYDILRTCRTHGSKGSIIHYSLIHESRCSLSILCLYPLSPALSVIWHDSKRAIHLVPKTSCREGNDEAKKKPRDTQVESPWLSDPLTFSVLWLHVFF